MTDTLNDKYAIGKKQVSTKPISANGLNYSAYKVACEARTYYRGYTAVDDYTIAGEDAAFINAYVGDAVFREEITGFDDVPVSSTLKRCPFCGCNAAITAMPLGQATIWCIQCVTCQIGTHVLANKETVLAQWNSRADDRHEIRITTKRCNEVLHFLRNPCGHSEEEMRKARLYAANIIEEFSKVESEPKQASINEKMLAFIKDLATRPTTKTHHDDDVFRNWVRVANELLNSIEGQS